MKYIIGSARHDENGRYHGGKAGDQTKQEVATQEMYDYFSKGGWVCYRFINPEYAEKMREGMLIACANEHIGYNQYSRYGVVYLGIEAAKDTNCDCSTLIRAVIRYACGKLLPDFTTANEGKILEESGLFKKVGIVTKLSKLYDGDILVTVRKGHTASIVSGHKRNAVHVESKNTKIALLRNKGAQYAKTFCSAIKDNDDRKTIRAKVLQHALNLDYKTNLKEDGIIGSKTKRALGNHYVEYKETQYLVSCAEIYCYMFGSDPNGYECPGIYGKGLRKATGENRLNAEWFLKNAQ